MINHRTNQLVIHLPILCNLQEQGLEEEINDLADTCGPLLEMLAPDAFFNMTGKKYCFILI